MCYLILFINYYYFWPHYFKYYCNIFYFHLVILNYYFVYLCLQHLPKFFMVLTYYLHFFILFHPQYNKKVYHYHLLYDCHNILYLYQNFIYHFINLNDLFMNSGHKQNKLRHCKRNHLINLLRGIFTLLNQVFQKNLKNCYVLPKIKKIIY